MTCELNGGLPSFEVPYLNTFVIFINLTFKSMSSCELMLVHWIRLNILRSRLCFNRVTRWTNLLNVKSTLIIINRSRYEILNDFVMTLVKLRRILSEESVFVELIG